MNTHTKHALPLKKVAIILVVLVGSAMIFASCKTHESCPAYGSIEKQEVKG
ncbi:MAG: hypothetical protein POELPBGB_00462 [Bacteroidia bacterium]|nr:hypothetical protein [Bacteroidia bacterium]